ARTRTHRTSRAVLLRTTARGAPGTGTVRRRNRGVRRSVLGPGGALPSLRRAGGIRRPALLCRHRPHRLLDIAQDAVVPAGEGRQGAAGVVVHEGDPDWVAADHRSAGPAGRVPG